MLSQTIELNSTDTSIKVSNAKFKQNSYGVSQLCLKFEKDFDKNSICKVVFKHENNEYSTEKISCTYKDKFYKVIIPEEILMEPGKVFFEVEIENKLGKYTSQRVMFRVIPSLFNKKEKNTVNLKKGFI